MFRQQFVRRNAAGLDAFPQRVQEMRLVGDQPAGALPPYDAFILLSPDAAEDRALHAALAPLANAISNTEMRTANGKVDLERETVMDAALWLTDRAGD